MVYGMPVKTTVVLKDEVYEYLVEKFGKRRISEAINQALMKQFFKPFKSMFGVDPWLTTKTSGTRRNPMKPPDSYA
jgi:hypothetical protein